MSGARPYFSDARRRTRQMRRHLLDAQTPAADARAAAEAMVGLHATTPSTVYLSTRARVPDFDPAALDTALYVDRTLVKQLAMRRTMFVLPREILPAAIGAVGPRVAASERTNMLRDLRRSEDFDDPEGWIDAARAAVLAELDGGDAFSSTELRTRLPVLDRHVVRGDGKWGGRVAMGPRVLNMMSAAGDIVRGPNTGGWHVSRPSWVRMQSWLGEPLAPVSVHDGHRTMIERWLRSFGPGTENDLVWWLGSTKTAVRAALADLDVVAVDLDGDAVGYVLADGADAADEPCAPTALLLPELDPTTMGHKDRGFYLGDHAGAVFDRNGNGGQTAWWDGRIVGGWSHAADGSVRIHALEELSRPARRALDEQAEALSAWLGEMRLRPSYPAPFMDAQKTAVQGSQ